MIHAQCEKALNSTPDTLVTPCDAPQLVPDPISSPVSSGPSVAQSVSDMATEHLLDNHSYPLIRVLQEDVEFARLVYAQSGSPRLISRMPGFAPSTC